MPKYIVKECIIYRFLQKIFAKAAAKGQSRVINKLSKKDPNFAKDYQTLVKMRNDLEKRINKQGIDIDQRGADILRNL